MKDKSKVEYEKEKGPWDFKSPTYDDRSSCAISAGTHYGVGFKTPVGSERVSEKSAVPYGKIDTLKVGYIHRGSVNEYEAVEQD